jgi:hypothetical protein
MQYAIHSRKSAKYMILLILHKQEIPYNYSATSSTIPYIMNKLLLIMKHLQIQHGRSVIIGICLRPEETVFYCG